MSPDNLCTGCWKNKKCAQCDNKKTVGGVECWYVGLGGEIPQHMQVFSTEMHGAVLNYHFLLYLRFCNWVIM